MKDKRQYGRLYVLQGSTVTSDVIISTSSLFDTNITQLRHMHLGHMNEIGIAELSKR